MNVVRCWVLGIVLATQVTMGFSANPKQDSVAVLVEKENTVQTQIQRGAWTPGRIGQTLNLGDRMRTGEFSRAAIRFTDLSMLRVDELTTITISPPVTSEGNKSLDVKRGGVYFFSRDKAQEIEIRTPVANGALRGTEFELRVAASGRTRLAMFDGAVELKNEHGSILLQSGEQGEVEPGRAPRKTAMIEAVNLLQWCLYYPAILDPADFAASIGKGRSAASLEAYRAGDLLGALDLAASVKGTGSLDERVYRAALVLAVGRVDTSRALLSRLPRNDPRKLALEQMIAAVKGQEWTRANEPTTGSEWMAESYYRQSRHDLDGALQSAVKATQLSPDFGFAWSRVAELEFSQRRNLRAMKSLERSLELAPKNAQAYALQGYLLAGENRMGAARRSFDTAIALDGGLGNAWLGRGLISIRQNRATEGRYDLQTAAVLEPTRAILRSYLGKAFSQAGIDEKANLELERAQSIDPADPTSWLYSAIQRKQENRYNEAISDLEKSVKLNDNRRLYRSQFLLDQDRAVRSANLAAIYQGNGMLEQSVREAVRGVNADYSSAAAHLFLANSYNALRDPTRVSLRYETAWSNEQLLANLLSPVGGGPLSQFVSEQEYSKLFEKDGLGINSITSYSSKGDFRQIGSQYGTWGNVSYAIDADYQYNDGIRPNNLFSRLELFGSFKLQLTPNDVVFFQSKSGRVESGDVFQRYNPDEVSALTFEVTGDDGTKQKLKVPNTKALSTQFEEQQDPGTLLLGWHHEWSPGQHTLLLLGRLASRQSFSQNQADLALLTRDVTLDTPVSLFPFIGTGAVPADPALFAQLAALTGRGFIQDYFTQNFDLDYHASFETYSAELQHISETGPNTLLLGARYQSGEFETKVSLGNINGAPDILNQPIFGQLPVVQDYSVDYRRLSLYAYETLRLTRWLSLTGGVTYDDLTYPENFRFAPVNNREKDLERVSPKAGVVLTPWRGAIVRGAFSQSINGPSFDESVRLEPTQVAGFLQGFRSVAPESLVGSNAGSRFQTVSASFEQRLPSRTYFGIEFNELRQNFDRTVGLFDQLTYLGVEIGVLPSSLEQHGHYREQSFIATFNQLVGDCWSFGGRYQHTHSVLRQSYPALDREIPVTTYTPVLESYLRTSSEQESNLHQLNLFAIYNHPSGFFARADANWYSQDNDNFVRSTFTAYPAADPFLPGRVKIRNLGLPGEDFWQFNFLMGYRFSRNQCEVSVGALNLTSQDYALNPLNPYVELPRERTFVVRCRLSF